MKERLQKLIASAGLASRRAAEELIREGRVTINGTVVRELGTRADPQEDHIKVNGKLINPSLRSRSKAYILLNKPKGILSAVTDAGGKTTVADLVRGRGRLFPVGRLDMNSEGLIILTNDGSFANHIASSRTVPKTYEVKVKGLPPRAAINRLRRGLVLDDGFRTGPADIKELPATDKNAWFEVILFEGHNQQIRRMFDAIGFSVTKLKRVGIGPVRDPQLKSGAYRELTKEEVENLLKPKN